MSAVGRVVLPDSQDVRPHPLEKLYFAYLLLAPLGATTMATVTYAGPADFMLFVLWLGGAVAISIYAMFVGTYLVAPKTRWRAVLAIVDGPLWLVIAMLTLHGWQILDLTTWFFVAESIAIYLAIALVAVNRLRSNALAIVGIMIACIAVVCFACGWALLPKLEHDLRGALLFAVSIAQATVGSYWIVDRHEPVRESDASTDANGFMILKTIGLMQVAIGLGALLRFVVLR